MVILVDAVEPQSDSYSTVVHDVANGTDLCIHDCNREMDAC